MTRIFAKTDLLNFLLERATVTRLAADRSGGSVAAFSHLYMPRMHQLGFVAPNPGEQLEEHSPGGFVMEPQHGLYDSVLVINYKSLYPSIIRIFLIDPVGMVEGACSIPMMPIPYPVFTRRASHAENTAYPRSSSRSNRGARRLNANTTRHYIKR